MPSRSRACGYSGPRYDRYGLPVGPISATRVEKQPLSHPYYPGSKPFYFLDSGSSDGPGSGPAYAGAILASDATGAQIYSWYIAKLKSMGWSFVTDDGCVDTQVTCPQFHHDGYGIRESFLWAIDRPTFLQFAIPKAPPPACTIYEMSYQLYPPGGVSVPGYLTWNGGDSCWWTGSGWRTPPGTR